MSAPLTLFSGFRPGLFTLSGTDHLRYLHGRLTQDIRSLIVGQGKRALVLTPQGRIKGQMLVLRRASDVLIVSDPLLSSESKAEFISALLQFKVADDVQLEDISDKFDVISLVGSGAKEALTKLNLAVSEQAWSHSEQPLGGIKIIVVNHPLGPIERIDIIIPKESLAGVQAELEKLQLKKLGCEEFEFLRTVALRPQMGLELDEKILAPEIPLEDLVSFNKGCYAGQEVVEMATARGRPNRKLVVVRGENCAPPAANSDILSVSEDGAKKTVGQLGPSIVRRDQDWYSLAFVKTSTAPESRLEVGTTPVSVYDTPLAL